MGVIKVSFQTSIGITHGITQPFEQLRTVHRHQSNSEPPVTLMAMPVR